MSFARPARLLPRGRVAKWTRDRLSGLSTPELEALVVNAERLKEPEVAALCKELLAGRPGGRRLVTRARAFAMHGVSASSRAWSCGGLRKDGAVMLALAADEVLEVDGARSYLLWAPNVGGSHPWSDTPGGRERLEHCRIALERGAAEGLLMYGKRAAGAAPKDDGARGRQADAETVLSLRVEKRGEEYWASCVASGAASGR